MKLMKWVTIEHRIATIVLFALSLAMFLMLVPLEKARMLSCVNPEFSQNSVACLLPSNGEVGCVMAGLMLFLIANINLGVMIVKIFKTKEMLDNAG